MNRYCSSTWALILLVTMAGPQLRAGDKEDAVRVARAVAGKVIRETVFEFEQFPQKTVLGIEVLDFRHTFGGSAAGVAYARSSIISKKDTVVLFGTSSSGDLRLWLNKQPVFRRTGSGHANVTEVAYNMVAFQDTFRLKLSAGANQVLIKSQSSPEDWVVLLRAMTPDGLQEPSVRFAAAGGEQQEWQSPWLYAGPFDAGAGGIEHAYPPETWILPYYVVGGRNFVWTKPPQPQLARLVIRPSNSYRRESYIEWHYAIGALHLAMLALADELDDQRYSEFTQKFCAFTMANRDFFRWQYRELHALRGSYHRLFRGTMLDDTGAPALPFVELAIRGSQAYRDIIEPIADYVREKQVRLADGTFCRPEPENFTVWADDLFMSVPFLLRMAQLTGDSKYYDDAAHQVKRFASYLFDTDMNLNKHGWFSSTGKRSLAFWGRANGWIAWATSETLLRLPPEHRDYNSIKAIFNEHMRGLRNCQDASGMWHQVLDHPESYEETSCTAMFVLAMARGVRKGWLDASYRDTALAGWRALSQKVDGDGTVHGICRGTGIGNDLDFYFTRKTFDHDPRGLGAVLYAAMEVAKLAN